MLQRNWLDLSRKLVDRYDLDFTLQGMSDILGEYALSFFGEGVLATTQYPNPFPITLSGALFQGTVGNGIGYDYRGFFTSIPSSTGNPIFTISPADPLLPRWDLLVIRYSQTGDTPVPKPSDPITTINLNLHDDYQLICRPGIPGAIPAYPVKQVGDIILAGIQVPAGASLGSQCAVDLGVRELGIPDIVKLPKFKQESLIGVVDGINKIFTLSLTPMNNQSILVFEDGANSKLSTDFSLSGNTITFVDAPALGQDPYAFYIVLLPSSQNPLAGAQEPLSGLVNGINATFLFAGSPADKETILLFVDGMFITKDQYSFTQTAILSSVTFVAGSIPQPGQDVYAFYMVNPASVGVAPIVGAASGFVPYGPLSVNPIIGIPAFADQRQLISVQSAGGAVPVTANPQIQPGSIIGQEMMLTGISDINYIILQDGNGLSLNGSVNLTSNETLPLFWTGAVWKEISRR